MAYNFNNPWAKNPWAENIWAKPEMMDKVLGNSNSTKKRNEEEKSHILVKGTYANELLEIFNEISNNYEFSLYDRLEMKDKDSSNVFDTFMREYIYNTQKTYYEQDITLTVIKGTKGYNPMFDSFTLGDVNITDYKNVEGSEFSYLSNEESALIFKAMTIIHFMEERFLVPDYEKVKIGKNSRKEYDKTHPLAIQKEVKYLKKLFPKIASMPINASHDEAWSGDELLKYFHYKPCLYVETQIDTTGVNDRKFVVWFQIDPR